MIGGKDSGVIPLSQKPPHYTKTYPTFMPPVYDWWFLTFKMEEEYNWSLISKVAVPIALVEGFLFYSNTDNVWKWISLAISLFLAGMLVYINDKKKGSIFTAIGIVFLIVLIVKFLKDSGFL